MEGNDSETKPAPQNLPHFYMLMKAQKNKEVAGLISNSESMKYKYHIDTNRLEKARPVLSPLGVTNVNRKILISASKLAHRVFVSQQIALRVNMQED